MSRLKATAKKSKLFEQIYALVKEVPVGRVVTYGQVARLLGLRDNRKVGWALHANKDPQVPCHRVVNKEGRLAPNFAIDGVEEQKRRLETEGVKFKDEMHVDVAKHLFRFDK
jgi:methylated-DNA-protein-cysteine methyltransferase-like protein